MANSITSDEPSKFDPSEVTLESAFITKLVLGVAVPKTEAGETPDITKFLKKHPKPSTVDDRPLPGEQKFGPDMKRPRGDDRSAEEIIKSNPTLAHLAAKDQKALAEKVGDYHNDPDAAYRASSVINHIEHFDEDGKEITGDSVGDGTISGWTRANRNDRKSEAKHGTEAGRFQDFTKYGYSFFKGDTAADGKPRGDEAANGLDRFTVRPEGDTRSAQDIIDTCPTLKNLAPGDKERLKLKVGDFENDADAAYRAVAVINMIENYSADGTPLYNGDTGNGKIDGYYKALDFDSTIPFYAWFTAHIDRKAKGGSEAARFEDFLDEGFSAFDDKIPIEGRPVNGEASNGLNQNTKRPKADSRSAEDIIKDNPSLANLSKKDKDALKDLVGDFETDADAAYRASSVINQIEHFDESGNELFGDKVGDGTISGWTRANRNDRKSEAKHGTEAGRFQDFIKYGFESLKGDAAADGKYNGDVADSGLDRFTTRPDDDPRSAKQIINDNPELKNLSDKEKSYLKKHCGDFENDADAAYRAVSVLNHIRNFDANGNFVPTAKRTGSKAASAYPKYRKQRLEDFGNNGFRTLHGDDATIHGMKKDTKPPEHTRIHGEISAESVRPTGDDRSAKDIIEDNPILANLSDKDKQALKRRVGDFENDPDAAFRAVAVLNHIEYFDADGNRLTGKDVHNGAINGFTRANRNDPKSEAKHGTEAGRFQDFIDHGYSTLTGHADIDGIPVGLDKRDIPRDGIGAPDDLPAMPLSLDDREEISTKAHEMLNEELDKAPKGSKAKILHNLIHMYANADQPKFKGKVDKDKLEKDIAALLDDPEIVAIQERIEDTVCREVTGKTGDQVVAEVEDILSHAEVQDRLDQLEPGVRARYVKNLIDTVGMFDSKKANELRGAEASRTLDDILDPTNLENMTVEELTVYVEQMLTGSLSISRITNGTVGSFAGAYEKLSTESRERVATAIAEFFTSGKKPSELSELFNNHSDLTTAEANAGEEIVAQLKASEALGVFGTVLAGVAFFANFRNVGGQELTPQQKLLFVADAFSMTGQIAGSVPFWKAIGIAPKARNLIAATQNFYQSVKQAFGGKIPEIVDEALADGIITPMEMVDIRNAAPNAKGKAAIDAAIERFRDTMGVGGEPINYEAIDLSTVEDIDQFATDFFGKDYFPENTTVSVDDIEQEISQIFEDAGLDPIPAFNPDLDFDVPTPDGIENMHPDMTADLNEALNVSGLREEHGLETITEEEALSNPELVHEQIAEISENGGDEAVGRLVEATSSKGAAYFLKVLVGLAPIGDLLYAGLNYDAAYNDFSAGEYEMGTLDTLAGVGLTLSGGFGAAGWIGGVLEVSALSGPLFPIMTGFGLAVVAVATIGKMALQGQKHAKAEAELDKMFKGGAGNDENYYLK
ncbi:hypothetical protein [Yoonia maritima]|uniref:hypothetical protein n=1 Tax=Yoonia maritima TaxID=1435347 RepID=UPI000D10629A|nr:hypothetical protein [Yoonia maritima]